MLFILVSANQSQASVYCSKCSPLLLNATCTGMFGSPIDECNMLQTSLDALDMFDLVW